ncbi:2-hydroxyacid dehydrogenase [Candidatus Galacturonibacter soehngenii]|uniref:2-hydroxyacid dehydrogenase n=1 Tax=Candidatus Galacturonatibacter soehngenii TaxID=2307010 RepID=A0A7V7UB19_9FIRM|nr:2-hydroxyacid dehydrogenase [Candidatus Galacturonibacter soehngenii]KAB1435862.1 2-hydroxyacid dehydrogenase [Candidatus Galacturonibacter soehngenii]
MKIAFFGTKEYDKKIFNQILPEYKHEIKFFRPKLSPETAIMAQSYDAVCGFVNDIISKETLQILAHNKVKLLLLRCAGYNNVDLEAAKENQITVLNVPSYSPEAVAEHTMALVLSANRKIHKSYNRIKENNFSLEGLNGINLHGKVAGIIGTGKIGIAFAKICSGFGMKVVGFDQFKNPDVKGLIEYVELDGLLETADLISLHCPLMESTRYIINKSTIEKMKDGVILVNTSRGGLIKTEDLINGIKANKFSAVGLDVFEEETNLVFDDHSTDILNTTTVARLTSFPNVVVTSHQGFFTNEALNSIARTTLNNADEFEKNKTLTNQL